MKAIDIEVRRHPFIAILVAATVALSALGAAVEWADTNRTGNGWLFLFNLDREWNIPTIFSALILFAAALALAAIATRQAELGRRPVKRWAVLAAIFVLLGIDELVSLHNLIGRLVVPQSMLATPAFKFRWVVPGMIGMAIFVLGYLRFLFQIPKRVRLGMVIAGMIYVGGALGVEMLGAAHVAKHTKYNAVYGVYVVIEETMEMVGGVLFLAVLLAHLETELGGRVCRRGLRLRVRSGAEPAITIDRSPPSGEAIYR